jgi:glycosyltransferase involved in cell wall biosynthesis
MEITVLLATCRRDDTLRACLESLLRVDGRSFAWEALIVDNAGQQSTRELVESYRGQLNVRYLLETTPGKNNALNHALEDARGELFVFTDDDIVAEPSWLYEMWRGAARWPDHAVFAGRILPKWPGAKDPPFGVSDRHIRAAFVIADWGLEEGPIASARVWGPNMAVRAQVFSSGIRFNPAVGPRGSNYVMGSETELTTRLENQGMGAVYLPRSVVWHQIRQEQLTVKWLHGRSYRAGRAEAFSEYSVWSAPRVLGLPRFLLRQLAAVGIARILARLRSDREEMLKLGMTYWRLRGSLHQCILERRNAGARHAQLPKGPLTR